MAFQTFENAAGQANGHQMRAIARVKFEPTVFQMPLHSARGDFQFLCNFFCREPICRQCNNVLLSISE